MGWAGALNSCYSTHLLNADEAQVLCHEHTVSVVVGAQAMLAAALPNHLLRKAFDIAVDKMSWFLYHRLE